MANTIAEDQEPGDLIDDLLELKEASGGPSLRALEASARQAEAQHGDVLDLPPLSVATMSRVLGRKQAVPEWPWVAMFVLACQHHARSCGATLDDPGRQSLPGWHQHYRARLRAGSRAAAPPTSTAPADQAVVPHALTVPAALQKADAGQQTAGPAPEPVPELVQGTARGNISMVSDKPGRPDEPSALPAGELARMMAAYESELDGSPNVPTGTGTGAGAGAGEPVGNSPENATDNCAGESSPEPSHKGLEFPGGPTVGDVQATGLETKPPPPPPAFAPESIHAWIATRYRKHFGEHGVALLHAANDGDTDAACRLGILLLCWKYTPEAIEWLQSAAAGGDTTATVLLGTEPARRQEMAAGIAYDLTMPGYHNDTTATWRRPNDPTGAETYYRAAAFARHPGATFQLALMAQARGDNTAALNYLKQAANAGHPTAQARYDALPRDNP
ncbi:hypothetical protein GCM10010411_74530 [Actinomadura fulvescens]|uniref:Sel1 repeat family protein n=1 Tax=Actinomadura fulvescens TaxID=46160 RepID=A0ABN3QI82_9ACTN